MSRIKPKVYLISDDFPELSYIQLVLTSMNYEILRTTAEDLLKQPEENWRTSIVLIRHSAIPAMVHEQLQSRVSALCPRPVLLLLFQSTPNPCWNDSGLWENSLNLQTISTDFLPAFSSALESFRLRSSLSESLGKIVGHSPQIRDLYRIAEKASLSSGSVLITGESGTGKELVARAIASGDPKKFVVVNCSAIPENLFESELFGHVKGAFTGATNERTGLFEEADGGTLFLDEVGDMPLSVQTKLLRALQEGEIRAVGSNYNRKVNARIIAATNRNLEKDIKTRLFREDLFFRLNVIPVFVPPLRDRPDDIPYLVRHFISLYSKETPLPQIKADALELLQIYEWPGNVRELENIIHRALVLKNHKNIDTSDIHLPQEALKSASWRGWDYPAFRSHQHQMERDFLIRALIHHNGSITQTAQSLRINRTALHNRIRRLNLNTEFIRKTKTPKQD